MIPCTANVSSDIIIVRILGFVKREEIGLGILHKEFFGGLVCEWKCLSCLGLVNGL